MKYLSKAAILLVLVSFLASCSTRIGDFTVISTKNVPVETGGKFVKKGSFEGDDIAWIILFIPTGMPNLKTAVDRCIENGNGDLITNAVLSTKQWYFLIGQTGYNVKGDVWRAATTGDLMDPQKEIFELQNGPQGKVLISMSDKSKRMTVLDSSNPNSWRFED